MNALHCKRSSIVIIIHLITLDFRFAAIVEFRGAPMDLEKSWKGLSARRFIMGIVLPTQMKFWIRRWLNQARGDQLMHK